MVVCPFHSILKLRVSGVFMKRGGDASPKAIHGLFPLPVRHVPNPPVTMILCIFLIRYFTNDVSRIMPRGVGQSSHSSKPLWLALENTEASELTLDAIKTTEKKAESLHEGCHLRLKSNLYSDFSLKCLAASGLGRLHGRSETSGLASRGRLAGGRKCLMFS